MSRREADFPGEPKTIGDLMGVTPMTNAPAQPVQGVEAVAAILGKARSAYINVMQNSAPEGDTSADRRHSQGEIRAAAEEAMFEEFGALTFEQVEAMIAALPREAPAAVAEAVAAEREACLQIIQTTLEHRAEYGWTGTVEALSEEIRAQPLYASPAPAPEAPAGWQDISTAPKDGTVFFGIGPDDKYPQPVRWDAYSVDDAEELGASGYWAYCEDLIGDVSGAAEPSYWRPMFDLPALATQADDPKGESR